MFGLLEGQRTGLVVPVVLAAGTDNQSNEYLMRKGMTTRWPLTMINMQLSELLMEANARLQLSWRPRDTNQEADDLTNEKFEKFDMAKRLVASWEDFNFPLIKELYDNRKEFLDPETWRVEERIQNKEKFEKSSW